MSAAALSVVDLNFRYGYVPAVQGVGLEVGVGQIVTVIGPNGAGKSTTLNAIMGVLRPAQGRCGSIEPTWERPTWEIASPSASCRSGGMSLFSYVFRAARCWSPPFKPTFASGWFKTFQDRNGRSARFRSSLTASKLAESGSRNAPPI